MEQANLRYTPIPTSEKKRLEAELLAVYRASIYGVAQASVSDVHEMMYAIGVEATQDELGQQTQLTIEESIFIDWMLGGMRRSQSERDANSTTLASTIFHHA